MTRARLGSCALVLAALAAGTAAAQTTRALTPIAAPPSGAPTPPQTPALRVDAEFHTQVVNRFAQDVNGRVVVTGSDDKTIRIWNARTGAALQTLRVPIGPGNEGQIYAVAISPDGRTLLAGGSTGFAWDNAFALYLFDLTTGRIKGRLADLAGPINDVAFSPDGSSFAIAMGAGGGVRLISATGSFIASDVTFRDRVTSVTFDARGRLYATGFDGEVRAYDPAGTLVARRTPLAGAHAYTVAVSPDGRTVAVGYTDQPRVELLNAADLSPRATLNTDPNGRRETVMAGLQAVAWGADGSLFAAGSLIGRDGNVVVRHWGPGGAGRPVDWAGPKDAVFQIRGTPDGGAILVSADPAMLRLDRNGQVVYRRDSPAVATRDLQDRPMRVSPDGMRVVLATRGMDAPWTVDLAQHVVGSPAATRGLTPVPAEPQVLTPAPVPGRRVVVTDWRNSRSPKIDGLPLRLAPEEQSRSYAVTPAGDLVLLGTDYRLGVYRRDGSAVGSVDLPATVWGVGVSGDGRVAVAAVGDGTLRWFGLDANGQLTPRVSLFLAADGRRWVAWNPAGFFDYADTGGESIVGVLLNTGRNQSPDWLSFAQVYRRFYAPETVLASLHGAAAAPPGGGPAGGIETVRQTLSQDPPPAIDIRSVCWSNSTGRECKKLAASTVTRSLTVVAANAVDATDVTVPFEAESVTVQYGLRGQGGGTSTVDFFVNGHNGGRARRDVSAAGQETLEQTAALGTGMNRLQLRAYDRRQQTYAESRPIDVLRSPPSTEEKGKPDLYVLSVAVDKYVDGKLPHEIPPLGFAVADAQSVTHTITAHVSDIYNKTYFTELYDDRASTNSVVQAMADIGSKATERDTVLIYLSGHGFTLDQRYYYITQNVHAVSQIQTAALSEGALVSALAKIKSTNTMVFLDTCHAGAFSLDQTANLGHETGRYVLAAASSVEEEADSYDGKNGVFATALLRGLAGRASMDKNRVDNINLATYAKSVVAKLAKELGRSQRAIFKVDATDLEAFPIVSLTPDTAAN